MMSIVIFFVIFFLLLSIGGLIAGHFEIEPKMQICPPPEEDEDFLTFKDFLPAIAFWLIYISIALFLSHLLLSKAFNLETPFSFLSKNLDRNEQINRSLSKFELEVEKIETIFKNFDKVTLKDAPKVIENALQLINDMYAESKYKEQIIKELSQRIKDDKIRAENAKNIAESFENLKKEQIDNLRKLLTEDARVQSVRYFWYGVIVSLPISILSSLITFWFTNRQIRKKKKANLFASL